jgi:integrase
MSLSFNGGFFLFINHIIKKMLEENRTKSASILRTACRNLEQFRGEKEIPFEDIDCNLMQRFELWLTNRGISRNTVSCYMRSLRAVYNQAVERGLTTQKKPFVNVYTGIDKTVKRAVNEDIIVKLTNFNLLYFRELDLARDLFLFSFYMRGISFVDMANLRKSNVQKGYIVYTRSKTRKKMVVRIEPCMQKIIEKYRSLTFNDYLLPVITSENSDYASKLRSYNKRLRRISEMLGLEKTLSSYVARHTWATIALRRGISIEIISEGMGHENEATTRIYLASLGQSVVDNANAKIISSTSYQEVEPVCQNLRSKLQNNSKLDTYI